MPVWLAATFSIFCLIGTVPAIAADPTWTADEQAAAGTDDVFHLASREKHGQDERSTGMYARVWQRQKDDRWRFVRDGGTPNQ